MKAKDTDCYENCVANICRYMDFMRKHELIYTAFHGSTTLAICFNLPKQKTLKDIIKYREKS